MHILQMISNDAFSLQFLCCHCHELHTCKPLALKRIIFLLNCELLIMLMHYVDARDN